MSVVVVVGVVGCHRWQLAAAAAAATVTQQPDDHQRLFCWKVGHSVRQTVTARGRTQSEIMDQLSCDE